LGFEDGEFVLPPLEEREHIVKASTRPDGFLFDVQAVGLKEQREERRRTIKERCEKVAALVSKRDCSIAWCHFNAEGDLLERSIKGAVQISGKDDDDAKERKLLGFLDGTHRVLVSKSVLTGFGLNLQHCAHIATFPSHSWEQYYQSIRRCYRFGQKRPVSVDIVASEGERGVLKNLKRKAAAADRMFDQLVRFMNDPEYLTRDNGYEGSMEVPGWLSKTR
jgi:hypothetical protein